MIKDPVDSDPQSPDAQKWAHQLLTRFRNVDDYAVPMPNVVVSPTISSPSTPPSEQDFSLSTPKLSFQAPTSLDVSMLSQDTGEVNITQAVAEYFFADSCVGSIPSDDPARPPSSETKLVPSIIVNEYMDISKPVPLVCKQVRDPWLRAYDNIHLAAPPMSWNAPRTRRNGATPLGFTNVSNANGSAFNMSRNRPSSCVSSVFKVNVAGPFSPQIKTISPAPYFWGMTASNQLFS